MINEIIALLNKYTDRFVDNEYYIELSKILTKYNNISEEEFSGVKCLSIEEAANKFNTSKESFMLTKAFFYEPEEAIYLLPENIKMDTKTWKDYRLTNQEHYLFSNLLRSEFIFHELEHVVQKKGKKGLEGLLVNNCPAVQESSAYAISPSEHFANLNTYLNIILIATQMNLSESVINFFKSSVVSTLYQPYLYNEFDSDRKNKKMNEPIIEFFNKVDMPFSIDYEYMNNLDFLDRIIFEFPITKTEFSNFINIINVYTLNVDKLLERLDMYSKMDVDIIKGKSSNSI